MLLDSTHLQKDGINLFLDFGLVFYYQKRASSPCYLSFSPFPFSWFIFPIFLIGSQINAVCLFFAHINSVNTLLRITSIGSLKMVGLKQYLLLHSCISQSSTHSCYSKCGTAHHNKLSLVRKALVSVSSPMKALSIEGIHMWLECFQIKHFIII